VGKKSAAKGTMGNTGILGWGRETLSKKRKGGAEHTRTQTAVCQLDINGKFHHVGQVGRNKVLGECGKRMKLQEEQQSGARRDGGIMKSAERVGKSQ